jgi:hypothetical protein
MSLPYFSSVPAQSVPGQLVPGFLNQQAQPADYQYIGSYLLYYLDYIDVNTLTTLTASPGNAYAMQVAASRAGLGDPPPDGRWGTPSAPSYDSIEMRVYPDPISAEEASEMLLRARKHSSERNMRLARGEKM